MKKSLFVTLGLAAMVVGSLSFTNDDGLYKNLKVLPKDITEKQMDSVMHHYTAALNVKCNFCHVRREGAEHPDFASDENKHKLITRDMMKMTNKINKEYFDLTGAKQDLNTPLMVTCYTCHHGSTEPAVKPLPRQQQFRRDSVQKQ
jgi:hypothetical protein